MARKLKKLKHWKGVLMIAVAAVTPFAMYGNGDTTLKGAIFGSVVGILTASLNWIDRSLEEQTAPKALKPGKDLDPQ